MTCSASVTTARHYRADRPGAALLVLAHGAAAGQTHPFMVAMASGLAARGVDVVTFDFPYTCERRPVPDRPPVLEACFARVLDDVRQRPDLRGRRLFIGGKSMGGRIATHLGAAGVPGLEGIIVLGYPLHPPARPGQLRVSHLPSVTVPVLVVQGERDAFGTPAELEPHLRAMPRGASLHVVAGGDHSLAVRGRSGDVRESVLKAVAEWMEHVRCD